MSFLEILLDARSAKERRKKQACAILIAVTAILLVVAIIAFAICQVVNATSDKKPDDEKTPAEAPVDLGETTSKVLSEEAKFSGNLLTLSSTARYKGNAKVVNLQERSDRPKNDSGDNSYTVLKDNRKYYNATEATAAALNKMLKAFYDAKKDDNLFIANAYNSNEIETQDAIFSSGEAIALSYFHDYATTQSINDQRSIANVDTYKWIYTNAHKYGFIAVGANSNIFRYVGVTHATAAKANGLYLESYLKQLRGATVASPMKLDANGSYVAYTCPISDVKVPNNYSYEISGNNTDGVIVTVHVTQKSANNVIE